MQNWTIPEKIQTGGLRTYFLEIWKILEILDLLLYPWILRTKQSFPPENSTKLCYTTPLLQTPRPKTNTH